MARKYISVDLKAEVFERARGLCEYCCSQSMFSPNSFEIEHIVPVSRGGETTSENLALSCSNCNSHKSNKIEAEDPLSAKVVPLFHPRRMDWDEHFTWSDDTLLMIGISPSGRATVMLLTTNRSGVMNLRQLLSERGQHPPERIKPIL
jgi:HNH endonuclease